MWISSICIGCFLTQIGRQSGNVTQWASTQNWSSAFDAQNSNDCDSSFKTIFICVIIFFVVGVSQLCLKSLWTVLLVAELLFCDIRECWQAVIVGRLLTPFIMLSKKKNVEMQYMGTSGKYVKKETAKPRSKASFLLFLQTALVSIIWHSSKMHKSSSVLDYEWWARRDYTIPRTKTKFSQTAFSIAVLSPWGNAVCCLF